MHDENIPRVKTRHAAFAADPPRGRTGKLIFTGVDGLDVYNISAPFRVGGRTALVQPRGRLVSNSCEALVTAAAAGLGLVQTPTFFAREALALELVEPVLDAFQPEPYPVSLVYPPSRRPSAAVRAFADFMAEELPPRL